MKKIMVANPQRGLFWKDVLLTLVLFIVGHIVVAQHATSVGSAINVSNAQGVFFNTEGGGRKFKNNEQLTLQEGAYLFKDWYKGVIINQTKRHFPMDKVNYNMETQSLEIERSAKKEHFTPDMIKGFVVYVSQDSTENITFISLPTNSNPKGVPAFYRVMVDGRAALLIRYEVVLTKGDYNPILNVGEKAKLKIEQKLYWFNGTTAQVLNTSRKKLLKVFADKEQKMEMYLKDKDTEDINVLKDVFNYYNQQD
jgi:hypothetical protein